VPPRAVRRGARAETYQRLATLLEPPRPARLDGLLDVDDGLGMTRLAWLRRGATAATPEVLKAERAKLEFLRAHGADRFDLSALPVDGGCWPRPAAAPPTRRCNVPMSTAVIRSCWRRWPRLTWRSSTNWSSCWIKRWPAPTPARGTSCLSASWSEHVRRSTAAVSWTRCSTCLRIRSCPTQMPDGWSVRVSACRGCRPLAARRRNGNCVITGTSICSLPGTSTCGPSPRRSWRSCR
jgi:hypothetical protein